MDPDKCPLERVEAGGVEHLLFDLGAVRAPAHQEQLRLEGGLSTIRVELTERMLVIVRGKEPLLHLVVVVVEAVPTVLAVSLLLVEVD